MNAIALDAERLVKAAAEPVSAGETVKAQMNRAARNLRYALGDWRVKAAWYREAGCWGAATFRDLEQRFHRWRDQEARVSAKATELGQLYAAIASRLDQVDPHFHSEDVAGLLHAARALGVVGGAVAPTEPAGE